MAYATIDGDMADFIEVQQSSGNTLVLAELRNYLIEAGHEYREVDAGLARWLDGWFVPTGETFALTPNGQARIDDLNSRI